MTLQNRGFPKGNSNGNLRSAGGLFPTGIDSGIPLGLQVGFEDFGWEDIGGKKFVYDIASIFAHLDCLRGILPW